MNIKLKPDVIGKIEKAIAESSPFGSVEIYIQNNRITQITTRHIQKENLLTVELKEEK